MVAAILGLALFSAPPVPAHRAQAVRAMNEGVDLVVAGDLAAATIKLRDAIEIDPTYDIAHYNLGLLYRRQNKLADAKATFRDALDASSGPASIEMRYRLAEVVLEMSSAEGVSRPDRTATLREALAHFEAVTKAEPGRAAAHLRTAWCLERLDRPAEADSAYRRAIDADPRMAAAYVGLGQLAIAYGHHNLGMAILEVGAAVNDTDPDAWVGLGHGRMAAGDPAQAVKAYETAKALDPDRVEVLLRLGLAHAELNARKDAVTNLEAFLSRAGADVPAHWKQTANATIARMQDPI
jgi:tetratricopeptide (TPR) repeat protein